MVPIPTSECKASQLWQSTMSAPQITAGGFSLGITQSAPRHESKYASKSFQKVSKQPKKQPLVAPIVSTRQNINNINKYIQNAAWVAKAAMMVALSGSVALVVTVDYHKTMAKGGAHTRPDQTPNHTMLHTSGCSLFKWLLHERIAIVQRFAQVKEQNIKLINA